MKQSPGVTMLSPAGQSLQQSLGATNETEEQRKKRLAAIAATRNRIADALSPAGASVLAGLGG